MGGLSTSANINFNLDNYNIQPNEEINLTLTVNLNDGTLYLTSDEFNINVPVTNINTDITCFSSSGTGNIKLNIHDYTINNSVHNGNLKIVKTGNIAAI